MENVNLLCSTFTKKADVKKHTGIVCPVCRIFCRDTYILHQFQNVQQ